MNLFEVRINNPDETWNPIRIVQESDDILEAGEAGRIAWVDYWSQRSSPRDPAELLEITRMSIKLVGEVTVS